MKQGFLQSSRYSPGNMSRESLEALFVGRNEIMEQMLSRLMKSAQGPEKHYLLLVGPRGSGKTHFLALLHHRLMVQLDDADCHGAVLVAVLNEEEWGVASFLDLIVRILKTLAVQDRDLSGKIGKIYRKFSNDPDDAEAYAIGLLREHTQKKTLILFCENLLDLFNGLGDEGQKKLRAAIQQDGNWSIVASTPSLFSALTLQDNPFFGFFTIRQLEKLDFETALELLANKAAHESRPELARFLRTPLGRTRARAIHHLAAGNHRAYVVLFSFLDKESLDDLVNPFMQMVDDLTPYFQDRMRQLSPTQRKIVEFLSQSGVPTTIKDISGPCLMSQQTAAKQIGELVLSGFVRRTKIGRNAFCELSEPLMRLCLEVKDNRTRYFRLFVEFLRHWFTTSELKQRHSVLRLGDQRTCLETVHIEEALRRWCEDSMEPFRDALNEEAKRCVEAGDFDGLANIQKMLANDRGRAGDYAMWLFALVQNGDYDIAIEVGKKAAAKFPDFTIIHYFLAFAFGIKGHTDMGLECISRATEPDEEAPELSWIRAIILQGLDRPDAALRIIDKAIDQHGRQPKCLWARANILLDLRQVDEALDTAKDLLTASSNDLGSLKQFMHGLVSLGRLHDANSLARDLIEHVPDNVEARGQLASALCLSGEWQEAVEVAEYLVNSHPEHSHAYHVLGYALIELNRPEDAVAAFDKLLPTEDCEGLLIAASAVRGIGDFASAMRYLGRAAELQPDNRDLWMATTHIHILAGNFDAAAESASRIEKLPGCLLIGRLFAAQAAAATRPLHIALDVVGTAFQTADVKSEEQLHLEAVSGILNLSVCYFGPRFLPDGLAKLRGQLGSLADDGILGKILSNFLHKFLETDYLGSLPEWEMAFDRLNITLADLDDCRIPLQMLTASLKYTKTEDERHLLSLPLEQRQLLESAFHTRQPAIPAACS